MNGIVLVTDETFEDEVIRSPLPVVVDFFADWSVPSRAAELSLVSLSEALTGRVKFTKINVNDSTTTANSFGIHTIPTYLFVDEGREKGREVGVVDPSVLRAILRKHFSFE
jgi:thioredoxin 1